MRFVIPAVLLVFVAMLFGLALYFREWAGPLLIGGMVVLIAAVFGRVIVRDIRRGTWT